MRITAVFIVRLLVDEAEPDAVRGIVRRVSEEDEHAFSNASRLLELLRSLSAINAQPTSPFSHQKNGASYES
jgi:hypothetical protein